MLKWWNKVDQALQLDKSITFEGSYQALRNKLKEEKCDFNVIWESNYTFQFHAYISIGTLAAYKPICGYGKLYSSKGERDKVEIRLFTKTRLEVYFFLCTAIIFMIGFLLSDNRLPIYIMLLFPLFTYLPWQLYRLQEQELFERFERFLMEY